MGESLTGVLGPTFSDDNIGIRILKGKDEEQGWLVDMIVHGGYMHQRIRHPRLEIGKSLPGYN